MSKPVAVLISDVHYNLQTLSLADAAMRQAIHKANELDVPLIVAGDLHDTKANLRGECVNAMIETFRLCKSSYILIGNHDRINEKNEAHSLNFLADHSRIISRPSIAYDIPALKIHLVPYYHDPGQLRAYLTSLPSDSCIIMHQGLKDSLMGDYIQDHSAITTEDVQDFRVISGHYHTRQDIKTGRPRQGAVGLWSYIGNSYTLSWGEAGDPEKGFQILKADGTLEFVPTNLRKHIIEEIEITGPVLDFKECLDFLIAPIQADDLLWIKIHGTWETLSQVSRGKVAKALGRDIFKLTLEPTNPGPSPAIPTNQTQAQTLDGILDKNENPAILKTMWRGLCE